MPQRSGNDLVLGYMSNGEPLMLSREARAKHTYVCGTTGMGKSKLLEGMIRQDLWNWSESQCGMLVLDPHGLMYDDLLAFASQMGVERPIIPIDLRKNDWVVSYNLLRQRSAASSTVIVDAVVMAMAHVWGSAGTDATPLFARWASSILQTLYEKHYTLVEAINLLDSPETRRAMTAGLKDQLSGRDWRLADSLSAREFEQQISSTVNRFQRFLRNEFMRAILGQTHASLDLGQAIEEGAILLVNLATEGAVISRETSDLFATMLLSDLWTAAQERGKGDRKPFYVFADEFQRFVSPTIAENLDQSRGFGIHWVMAHQFPNQLINSGEPGKRLFDSVMENASTKIVFRLTHEPNLRPLAQWLFMGTIDPDEIKNVLYSTKVVAYHEETRTSTTRSRSRSHGHGTVDTEADGDAESLSRFMADVEDPDSIDEAATIGLTKQRSKSHGQSESWGEGESEGETESTVLIPELGQEISSIERRPIEEQVFRAMQTLFGQAPRHCVVRLCDSLVPVSLRAADIEPPDADEEWVAWYREHLLSQLPYALRMPDALARLAARQEFLLNEFPVQQARSAEPPSGAARRIR